MVNFSAALSRLNFTSFPITSLATPKTLWLVVNASKKREKNGDRAWYDSTPTTDLCYTGYPSLREAWALATEGLYVLTVHSLGRGDIYGDADCHSEKVL